MKTISLQVEDNLYAILIALIQQLPADKVQIVNDSQPPPPDNNFEQVSEYILNKNAKLYERLA